MTLMDAKQYDPEKERRKKVRILSAIVFLLLAGFFLWWFRYWPEQRVAEHFFHEFYTDWGPGGQWGVVKAYKIYAAGTPPGGGSGVIVDLIVNDRAEHARVWVEKSDKTMSFSPY